MVWRAAEELLSVPEQGRELMVDPMSSHWWLSCGSTPAIRKNQSHRVPHTRKNRSRAKEYHSLHTQLRTSPTEPRVRPPLNTSVPNKKEFRSMQLEMH